MYDYLSDLEAEAIYVLREVAAQFETTALLFSGGKDSILVSYLAQKAFYPATIPFPLLHIDTGHNFIETIDFRDKWAAHLGAKLIIGSVQQSIDNGTAVEEIGFSASRNALQTNTLLETIATHQFDALIGGARRDEEKARAKERFFSHRDSWGQWNPKNQRPELWNLFNGRKHNGEHFRVFPISNWTELDVWRYIQREAIPLPSIYFTHTRNCFLRNGVWYAASDFMPLKPTETVVQKAVRFRTVGDMTCTGATESSADNIEDVIQEIAASRNTERGSRIDDKRSEAAMEERKLQGYF